MEPDFNYRRVTVIGTGYVGLTTAALLSHAGYKVFALDINKERLATIKQGRSFFFEHGLDALLESALSSGNLIPTDSYAQSIPGSSFVFSCVGTPDNPDGSSNLSYVFNAATSAMKHMKDGSVYVQKSTVPVGTGAQVEKLFQESGKNIPYVSNPEFLREGTALSDSLFFDRIVVGSSNVPAARKVTDLYKAIEASRKTIAHLADIEVQEKTGHYIDTNLNSAELIKVTANAFLALKISFANSIAKLADQTGADVNEVMDAVGADHRIGRAFLNAGRGYGGGCFPKDVSGLISSANDYGVDLGIITAAADLNETMPGYIASKLQDCLGGLEGKKIAVLGLAFKASTSDARRSPGVSLANILSHAGANVTAYDPEANQEAEAELRKGVAIRQSIAAATKAADAVCIATDWPEFLSYDLTELTAHMEGTAFVDCMNVYDISQVKDAGLQYIGVGRNGDSSK